MEPDDDDSLPIRNAGMYPYQPASNSAGECEQLTRINVTDFYLLCTAYSQPTALLRATK